MKKILIKIIIFIIFIPVIIGLVGMYKFNILQDDIYIEGSSLSTREQNLYLLGSWIEPVPGDINEVQGFTLKSDGSASSINMATLLYQNWEIKDDKLILTAKSIGNKTSSIEKETYKIISINKSYLYLKNGKTDYVYKKTHLN